MSRSPTSDYFGKRISQNGRKSTNSYMQRVRDQMKRDKINNKKNSVRKLMESSPLRKNEKFVQETDSVQRNSLGVRTSLMKELDKKIKSIAKTINCIQVSLKKLDFRKLTFLLDGG
jgi:phosphoenolpyruvate carboxylase